MYAKKSLGQHFLKSEKALTTIIRAGELMPGETVLEIGPGTGTLTGKLLAASCQVLAVEKDDQLIELLKEKFREAIRDGRLTLVHQDILDFDPSLVNIRYKVVANIPYNITGAILEKFLSADHQPQRMVLLVQKEVAERIVARQGKPLDSARGKESILSLSVRAYGHPRYVEKVLAGSFAPAPQVDSAIISIEAISKDFFNGFSENDFFRLLKAGFSSKRKKLSSNLSNICDKKVVKEAFQLLSLDENVRAEDINIEKWGQLAKILSISLL